MQLIMMQPSWNTTLSRSYLSPSCCQIRKWRIKVMRIKKRFVENVISCTVIGVLQKNILHFYAFTLHDALCSSIVALNMDPSVGTPLTGCLLPLLVINNTTAAPLPPVTPPLPPVCYTLGHYHLVRLTGFGEGDGGGPAGGTPALKAPLCNDRAAGSLCYRWTHVPLLERLGIGTISDSAWISLIRLGSWPCRKLRRTPCVPVRLIYVEHASCVT